MASPLDLDAFYNLYINNIKAFLPEGLTQVNINLLQRLNLLNYHNKDPVKSELTRYFHVEETNGKLTLANDQYVIWIVPENKDGMGVTFILIALNKDKDLQLELGLICSGIYNNSSLVLKILEGFLLEIQENEEVLNKLN